LGIDIFDSDADTDSDPEVYGFFGAIFEAASGMVMKYLWRINLGFSMAGS